MAVVEIGKKKKNESSQGGQAMNSLRAKRQCSGLWKDIALFPVSMGRLWLTWITLDFSILRYAVFWNANDYSSLSSCSAYIYIYITYLVVQQRQPTYQKLLIVAACSKFSKQSFSTKRIQSFGTATHMRTRTKFSHNLSESLGTRARTTCARV